MNEKHKVVVETRTLFIEEQSEPEKNRYVFAYAIKIRNEGTHLVQLLRRNWLITDSNGKVEEVNGSGVVGKQPALHAGESFEYTSGAVLETDVGVMSGKYLFIGEGGEHFFVPIPQFTLSIPRTLH